MKQDGLKQRLATFIKLKRDGMPLRAFAQKYGLSFASISRIEKLEQNVTINTLEGLCRAFKCDVDELFPK
jgi:transcriptional regulator with XRE-family HTH domain